jgi:iron complex transport system substrate-binding protein
MKKRFLTLAVTAAMALSLMTGCGKTAESTTASATEAATTEAATEATTEAVTEAASEEATTEEATEAKTEEATEAKETTAAKDRAGNDIKIPVEVNTIISMAPSTTRFLIDLGLSDKIVAVDTNSYSYIEQLPVGVQQFDMMAPDNEALVALKPDIIFTSGMSSFGGEDVFQPARDAGICVADIPSSNSIDDIVEDLKFIGDAVGASDKAQELIDKFKAQVDEVKAIGETIEDKKSILFMISLPSADYPSVYTFGKGTYLDEMITAIGATNVTGDQESWVAISEEEAVALNPDVIITNVNYVDDVVNVIKSSEGWENVTAIQNDAVYYIDADASNQPNNHVVDAMIEMAKKVYPDEFADFK